MTENYDPKGESDRQDNLTHAPEDKGAKEFSPENVHGRKYFEKAKDFYQKHKKGTKRSLFSLATAAALAGTVYCGNRLYSNNSKYEVKNTIEVKVDQDYHDFRLNLKRVSLLDKDYVAKERGHEVAYVNNEVVPSLETYIVEDSTSTLKIMPEKRQAEISGKEFPIVPLVMVDGNTYRVNNEEREAIAQTKTSIPFTLDEKGNIQLGNKDYEVQEFIDSEGINYFVLNNKSKTPKRLHETGQEIAGFMFPVKDTNFIFDRKTGKTIFESPVYGIIESRVDAPPVDLNNSNTITPSVE
jgi:hypothetical protein